MKNFIYTFVLSTLALLSSCTREGINNVPYDFASNAAIVADSTKVMGFISNIYSSMPTGYNRLSGNSMVAAATDEAVNSPKGSGAELWGEGSWGSNTLYDNTFAACYTGIRHTYDYFNLIEPDVQDFVISKTGKKQLKGQVLFLRALYNFEIFKRFGGYPIVLNALNVTKDDLNIPRTNYDECVKYISDLCDTAAYYLPTTWPNASLGRATKGAALALKSRLWLYAASPLFNDQTKDSDTPEHGKFDATKWEKAAAAANDVIKLNVYSLYPGATLEAFFYTLTPNAEIILSSMAAANNTVEKNNGITSLTGGLGGTCPSWNLVKDYEMINGIPFDWSLPANQINPFANRDPRFAKNILYNGATWMNGAVETFQATPTNGKDLAGNNATRTSFYLRKFMNISAKWTGTTGTTFHCWPIFRYAEILLNYAEAMNEAYGPDADPKGYGMTARAAVKMIRVRAGLTGNTDFSVTTAANYVPTDDKAKMRDAIRHERRIELAFEEHRHLDLRRWKLAQDVLNKPVQGLTIIKTGTTYTYTPVDVETRAFDPKMYLYPFPQTEISRNKNLVQNTGWN